MVSIPREIKSLKKALSHTAAAILKGVVAVLLFAFACCCSNQSPLTDEIQKRKLMQFGDSVLYAEDVVARIPVGLAASDSAEMFDKIVDDWLSSMLLSDMASRSNLDMRGIDRLVSEYRTSLIVAQYRQRMGKTHMAAADENKIKAFYDSHPEMMALEAPIIRGVYLKVNADTPQLPEIKRWMKRCTASDMDNIERYGLENALDYQYFVDVWTDWQTIASQVPARISTPRRWLTQNDNLEITKEGVTYMLHIAEWLDSGVNMPYEYARGIIAERLSSLSAAQYQRQLLRQLYQKSVKNGNLKVTSDAVKPAFMSDK